MKYDDVDLRIIGVFALMGKGDSITSYNMAKNLFDFENDYEARKKDAFVRNRLDMMCAEGLVVKQLVDGKAYYFPVKDKILMVKGALTIGRRNVASGEFLVVDNGYGVNVFQVNRS